MSKETLHLLLRMNHDRLETQIALQCAPLLTGVKISNLLTVTSQQEAAGLFEGTAVSCYMLYESREKTTFLLYLRSGLMEYLAETDVKRLMERFGYHAMKLERILERVSEKYTSHMDGTGGFPHEIGLLLGYPRTCWDSSRTMAGTISAAGTGRFIPTSQSVSGSSGDTARRGKCLYIWFPVGWG